MKRFVSLFVATGLALGAGAVMSNPASAAASRYAFAYSGSFYSGNQRAIDSHNVETDQFATFAVRSFINHTSHSMLGISGDGRSEYTFWSSSDGGWPTIGAPFDDSGNGTLQAFEVQ